MHTRKYETNPSCALEATFILFRDYTRVPGGEWRNEPKIRKGKEIEKCKGCDLEEFHARDHQLRHLLIPAIRYFVEWQPERFRLPWF